MQKQTLTSSSKTHPKLSYQQTVLVECIMESNKSDHAFNIRWRKNWTTMRGWDVQYSIDGLLRLLKT